MEIKNRALIGDFAVLFFTIGIFSWSFYNYGLSKGNERCLKSWRRSNSQIEALIRKTYPEIKVELRSIKKILRPSSKQ